MLTSLLLAQPPSGRGAMPAPPKHLDGAARWLRDKHFGSTRGALTHHPVGGEDLIMPLSPRGLPMPLLPAARVARC